MISNASNPEIPTVLVTGATRRLGRVIAQSCAQKGWRVALHARTLDTDAHQTLDICNSATPGAALFTAELTDERQVRDLVSNIVASLGRLDALVNSAALFEFDDASSFSPQLLAKHMAINTAAPVLLSCALAEHLAQRNAPAASGCVINLLDQKLFNPNPDFLSYTLSKAALQSATMTLAQALAPRVRVAAVAPGLTLPSPTMDAKDFEALQRISPLKQSSNAQEVADSVLFLLSNRAITGETLLVDGGQHMIRLERDFSKMNPWLN